MTIQRPGHTKADNNAINRSSFEPFWRSVEDRNLRYHTEDTLRLLFRALFAYFGPKIKFLIHFESTFSSFRVIFRLNESIQI